VKSTTYNIGMKTVCEAALSWVVNIDYILDL